MAAKKNGATSSSGTKQPTVAELREWYKQNESSLRNYELAEEQVKKLRDVNKNTTGKSVTTFSKDTVVNYLQNPSQNEKNLRNLSRYLFYRSNVYFRLIKFFSDFAMLDVRSVIPKIDLTKDIDETKMLKSYNQTLELLDRMNLTRTFSKVFPVIFREDVFYGLYWLDDDGMIIIPWDPDYAKISGITTYGTYTFVIDVSWFRSRQDILEYWGEPFTTLYNNYIKDGNKWQDVGAENGICLKFRDDWELIVPVFSGVFLDLINLLNLSELQSLKDEQDIFKLIYKKARVMTGNKNQSDDFEVSVDMDVEYFSKFKDLFPDWCATGFVLGNDDLGVIDFSDNQDTTSNATKVSKATTQVFNTAGGAEILDGANITSSAAFKAAQIANTRFALSSILPQIEGWVAMVLDQNMSNPCKVHFHMVSPYTKDDYQDDMLTAAQNGLPTALAYNTLNEFSERDSMALLKLQGALNIPSVFTPLSTSYTQSGSNGEVGQGRDPVPDDEISESGDRSRNA